jgi:hypothetical protein
MINDGSNNVPDKTIAVFLYDYEVDFEAARIPSILKKLDKTRSWFDDHFYRCLPLVIGNTYGFVITTEWAFSVVWDGGSSPDSVKIYPHDENHKDMYPLISSHFGHGILTISPPFTLRTPPGVNLMTINPPNCILPGITVMTGVIETDNIRRNFTFNLKIQIPNVEIAFLAGTALSGFIPIPRYYADSFVIKEASELFSEEVVTEEISAMHDHAAERQYLEEIKRNDPSAPANTVADRRYLRGIDIYGNKFSDHQKSALSKDLKTD